MLKLRYYQEDAIKDFFHYTANNWSNHPIVVLPTGSGKSLVQAYIVKEILKHQNTRVLMLTHQKELISQNYAEFMDNFAGESLINAGIYSAGLRRRDTTNRLIFAGIQSVYKRAYEMGWFDVILIDECHLIPQKNEGMYRKFLGDVEKINKNIVIGGLSATPYRMKDGLLTDGEDSLFDDICHETTIKELMEPNHPKNRDNKQYLCTLLSKNGVEKVDLSGVHSRGGDYIEKEVQQAFSDNNLIDKAIIEIKKYTENRKKILIFSAGIEHGVEVTEKLNNAGLSARMIHSKQSDELNNKNIQDYKDGKFKYLVNAKILTTGFNEKRIDCVIMLMSTKSPGLYYQIVGRGLRLHLDKENCLILDYGRNIERMGPIDQIEVKSNKKTGESEVSTAPTKECPECQSLLHLSTMECPDCGFIFEAKDKHDETASDADIISVWKKPKEIEVIKVEYSRHSKKGKPDSLRVDYYFDMFQSFSSWICLEHGGFAQRKAQQWIKDVTNLDICNVDEALEYCEEFRQPSKIIVDENSKFPSITGYIYNEPKKELETIQDITYIDVNQKLEELMF